MKITVDKKACIGCGLCEQVAPGVFTKVGDKAAVKVKSPSPADFASAKSAATQCPQKAISVK